MQVERVPPVLRGRVAGIDVARRVDTTATVLPSAGVVLGLQLRGRIGAEHGLLTPIGVTGLQERARRYSYLGDTVSILVRFTPQGATCLGVPVSELSGCNVALDDLLPPARVRVLHDELRSASSLEDQIERLRRFLGGLPFREDRLIAHALGALDGERPVRVHQLARDLGLSERQLERRFLARVGIGPRRYASLRRFERAVALAPAAPSLTHVAHLAGYSDQSHFVREVRRLAGSTPTEIFRVRERP